MEMDRLPMQEVSLDETVTYQCSCCGACCKKIKNAVLLDGLDLYRLATHLKMTPVSVLNKFTSSMELDESGYPIFVLNTTGAEDTCVFLSKNRCTVQNAKPRTCRLYPFTAGPGKGTSPLRYYLCLEKPYHFLEGEIHVGDWLDKSFSDEDRHFLATEYRYIPELACYIKPLTDERLIIAKTFMLFFRYFNFDTQLPFMPQYLANNRWLLDELEKLVQQERGLHT